MPDSCLERTPTIFGTYESLIEYKEELEECLNFNEWLAPQLEAACEVPTEGIIQLIESEGDRVEAAMADA